MYRDEEEAAQHRASRLRERVSQREQRISSALRALLPAELDERMQRAREDAFAEAKAGDLARALEHYDAVLDDVFALAPHLEEDQNALPEYVEPNMVAELRGLTFLQLAPELWAETSTRLPKYLTELDPEVRLATPQRYVLDALLTFREAPIAVRMQPHMEAREYTGEVGLALGTPVRMSTPALDLRPLAFAHSFTKLLRIHRDIEIGDEEIDGRYLIQGDRSLARRLLDARTRRDLLRIAEFDVPYLDVAQVATPSGAGRIARIRWRWDAKIGALRAALDILARARRLDTRVQMLHALEQA